MESAEYKKQYDEYLARAEKALSQACERYLPEGSDVCRAARYSLLGGGKRIRAVLVLAVCDMPVSYTHLSGNRSSLWRTHPGCGRKGAGKRQVCRPEHDQCHGQPR